MKMTIKKEKKKTCYETSAQRAALAGWAGEHNVIGLGPRNCQWVFFVNLDH